MGPSPNFTVITILRILHMYPAKRRKERVVGTEYMYCTVKVKSNKKLSGTHRSGPDRQRMKLNYLQMREETAKIFAIAFFTKVNFFVLYPGPVPDPLRV